MLFNCKLFSLSILFLSLALLNPHELLAVGDEAPIIALANNSIYIVSPVDGTAQLLVERSAEKDEALLDKGIRRNLELSQISPDNTKFAYTAPLYEMLDPAFEETEWPRMWDQDIYPRDITLVDIDSGQLTPITSQGANLAELIESDTINVYDELTWSIDGQRLYFISAVVSMRNRVPQLMIEYYDLQAGERRVLVKLRAQARIPSLYAVSQGLLLVDGSIFEGDYKYTLYDLDGKLVNSLEMPLEGTMQCSNPEMRNPVFMQDEYRYGYYTLDLGPAALLDVASGDSIPLEGELVPAFMSHTHPDTSLRVIGTNLCSMNDGDAWTVTDAEDRAMSIALSYIDSESAIALSPDGQSIAYLKYERLDIYTPAFIMVVTAEGTRELDFKATQIMWGAIDYTFASINERRKG